MNILGIETSCDETACAIYNESRGIIAHKIYSQIDLHQQYGGVVPELASRDHLAKITPLIQACLNEASLVAKNIDGIAYTKGPGLIGALLVGGAIAKSLAFAWQIPCLGVHHMEAHLMAVMLSQPKPAFPFVALLVSGGHTQLVAVKEFGEYKILGDTLDDAVGEAFDKTAKLLGLRYPGGPELEALAKRGKPDQYNFPRPMLHSKDLNFSFSGIKTFAANLVRQVLPQTGIYAAKDMQVKADIAYSFQQAVTDTLVKKCQDAINETGYERLVVVGGVSANKYLREGLNKKVQADVYFPELSLCTDNGAMVAYTGYLRLSKHPQTNHKITVKPRWALEALFGESA